MSPTPIPHPDGVEESLEFSAVVSSDGTRLRTWTNAVDGPTVLLCPGLGTPAYTWPGLLRPDCGVRTISWHHRGLHGSERPRDSGRIRTEDFVDDAVAVLDAAGVEACVVAG